MKLNFLQESYILLLSKFVMEEREYKLSIADTPKETR